MTVAEQVQAEEVLAVDLENYAGQWVAVRDHAVIAHAYTLEDLLVEIEGQTEVNVFQAADSGAVACFF